MVLREYDEAAHIANEKKISFEDGFKDGLRDGEQRILLVMIQEDLEHGISKEDITAKLVNQYQISPERIEEYFAKIQEKQE